MGPSDWSTAELGDRYEILGRIGSGGMAHVYRARDLRHDRDVAVKVIREEIAAAVSQERFLREIRITASLSHPNIPPLLDSGAQGYLLYYVMPLLEGETLAGRLRREGLLGLDEALEIARDLASALDYAHGQGVVHRDVKPANVFLEGARPILVDFGIAALADLADHERLTESDFVLGTAEYMSPEQCAGSAHVDGRSDVYSLGCVLFEMLTGHPPFTGRTRLAVIASQLQQAAPSPALHRSDLPVEVSEVVDRCLAKAPGDRFSSAGDLKDALDEAKEVWTLGHSRGRGLRVRRKGFHTKALAAGLVVVALLLAAAAWWTTQQGASELDPDAVVVFPLAQRGGVGGSDLGVDVGMMIINGLVHTDPLRAIDGWQGLDAEQRADARLISQDDARAIALETGAAHFITGGVTQTADSVTVLLVLHDAAADQVVLQASASGARGQVTPDRLGLRAMIDLLPELLGSGQDVDLSFLTDRNPRAVARWLLGDREYRRGQFAASLDAYRSAVTTDSLLIFAALKGAQAASWVERREVVQDLLALTAVHDTLLPLRYQHFARGLRAYEAGEADRAVSAFRTALEIDEVWAEAWTALGDTYRHLLPSDGIVGVSDVRAFERARELDPDFLPPLVHLAEYEILSGNIGSAREMIERLSASGIGEEISWVVLMDACAGASEPREELRIVPAPTNSVLYASLLFAAGGRDLACAEQGFRSVLERPGLDAADRWAAVRGLMGVLVNQGRVAELDSLLDASLQGGESATRFLYPLATFAGADLSVDARSIDEEAADLWGPDYEEIRPTTAWVLTLWNAYEGDLTVAETLEARLDEAASATSDEYLDVIHRAARSHLLLARGDSVQAYEVLDGLQPSFPRDVLDYGLAEPLAPERIVFAELLLARGEVARAYRVASYFDHPGAVMFVPFVARSLVVRARAAAAMDGQDWAERAAAARERLASMGRDDLMPPPP